LKTTNSFINVEEFEEIPRTQKKQIKLSDDKTQLKKNTAANRPKRVYPSKHKSRDALVQISSCRNECGP
jgi:hypothetical protein